MNAPFPFDNELLADVVRQATESIVVTDLDGNIEYVNPAFERVTGYAASEVLGRNPRVLRAESAAYPQSFYADMWRTISAGEVWRGEFTNRRKDGTIYVEEAVIFPIREAPSGPDHAFRRGQGGRDPAQGAGGPAPRILRRDGRGSRSRPSRRTRPRASSSPT